MSCGDEELLTKEGILGEELLLGAREIPDEPTARASGSAGSGRASSLNKPPTDTVSVAEEAAYALMERRDHCSQSPLSFATMEA